MENLTNHQKQKNLYPNDNLNQLVTMLANLNVHQMCQKFNDNNYLNNTGAWEKLKNIYSKPRRNSNPKKSRNVAPKREDNNAFFFRVSGVKIRVCKIFFKNTLGINNRPIETAVKKKNKETNISTMKDLRGSHGNHSKVDENIRNGVKAFIEAIPKIESHYIRANSKRHFIDGSKTITELHRDYVEQSKTQNVPFTTYVTFYRIFSTEYNISFFVPKKDLCDVCEAYKNSTDEEKESAKEKYDSHIKEKQLSRVEKDKDKYNENITVAVYDPEAVFQCPKGNISLFYYKSKLNLLNLTIYNIQNNIVECYV